MNIDGSGKTSIDTGISFLDHLITSFGKHSMLDLTVKAKSKDKIEHHLIEDTAIAIGSTIDKALGNRTGITRFSYASVPMDESLAETSLDLVKRPYSKITLLIERNSIDMDGTKDGYDIDLTREIVNSVSIPVVASGGCGKPEDMIDVFKKTDVEAALAASIFHYETHSVNRVKELIKENGIPVRI